MARRVDPMDAPPPPPRVRVAVALAPRTTPRAVRAQAPAPRRASGGQPWVLVGATAGFASTVLGFLATSLVG